LLLERNKHGGRDAMDVRTRLLKTDAPSEATDHEYATAGVGSLRDGGDVRRIDVWRRSECYWIRDARGEHTNHHVRIPPESERPANDASITIEAPKPETVTQNHNRRATPPLMLWPKEAAERRTYPKYVEHVAADASRGDVFHAPIDFERHGRNHPSHSH
jgi:hypothetical protein